MEGDILQKNDMHGAIVLSWSLGLPLPRRGQARGDMLEALWGVVRARRWRDLPPESVLPYLRTSVTREAARIRRDRERADRIWWRLGRQQPDRIPPDEAASGLEAPLLQESVGADMPDPAEASDPAVAMARQETRRVLRAVMSDLLGSALPSDQEQVLQFLLAGETPAQAVRTVGGRWSPYIALRKKLLLRLKKSLAA